MVTPKAPIPRKRLIVAASLAAFLLASSGAYYLNSSHSTPSKLSQAPSLKHVLNGISNNPPASTQGSQATENQLASSSGSTLTVDNQGVKTFTGLGVRFSFNSSDERGKQLTAKLVGNKILFGHADSIDNSTYNIQVFTKNPSDSLKTAIEQQQLKGYASTDCPVLDEAYQPSKAYPKGAERARISYSNDDPTKCPTQYVTDENGRSFVMDNRYPSKYFFIEAGQEPIGVFGGGQDWVSSLTIL